MENVLDNFGIVDVDKSNDCFENDDFYNYKLGDPVRFKTLDEMCNKYGSPTRIDFTENMRYLCGTPFDITAKEGKEIIENRRLFKTIPRKDNADATWKINLKMLIPVFTPKKLPEPAHEPIVVEQKRVCDKEILDKMISMVDKKSFKALMALGFRNKKPILDSVVDKYLELWANAKYEHFLMLGRKLVYSEVVETPISEEEMTKAIREFKKNDVLPYMDIYNVVLNEIPTSFFIHNKLGKCPKKFEGCFPSYVPGMKLSKFLSGYFKDTIFDIEFSKLMQNRIVKGGIHLSIDPIDYLTCAINKNGWSTCSGIYNGQYACGPFSQLLDESSLVCYQANAGTFDYSINGQSFKANNKICRAFILINKDTHAFAVMRAYPNTNNELVYTSFKDFCQRVISNYLDINNAWFTEVVTESMDGTSCHGTYSITNGMERVHMNKNKNYVLPGGHLVFTDPVKYVCSLENKKLDKFVMGVDKVYCPGCGKEMTKLLDMAILRCGSC